MRRLLFIAGTLAMMASSSAGTVSAVSQADRRAVAVVADVDGHPIKSALIGTFYCHDFDYPKVHCSRTVAGLRASERGTLLKSLAVTPMFGTNDYITIFDGSNYSGAFMDVSQNYDALFTIGWNDRISSYKARNSASGILWTDWFHSGTGVTFCCNTNVSGLPSGLDNAFSSLYRS
jgi:hypothetical protein